jgi:hypothetical protein
MSYAIGLVGKPSVGKSTFFNAMTMNDVPEGAYPFTTIDPSVGEAYVRVACAAPEFDETCTPSVGYCDDGTRFVPVQLVDVAGLIPGAHEGNGLGNQFLSDLNEADVLVHVVDFSGKTDSEGEPTEGHDPRDDSAGRRPAGRANGATRREQTSTSSRTNSTCGIWGFWRKGSNDSSRSTTARTRASRPTSPSR